MVNIQRTVRKKHSAQYDSIRVERDCRQLLSDKVSGNMMGIWLAIPEHLKLGTWDLLCKWTGNKQSQLEPRIALQMIHESMLCIGGIRHRQEVSLSQKGFELANGLPFIASDLQIHDLCKDINYEDTLYLQTTLGKIRMAAGHYKGKLIAVDPHHIRTWSKRMMRLQKKKSQDRASKTLQSYFCIDADTHQPFGFTINSPAVTVSKQIIHLLQMTNSILQPSEREALVLTDKEHFNIDIFDYTLNNTPFNILIPMPKKGAYSKNIKQIESHNFIRRWPGYATFVRPFHFEKNDNLSLYEIVQRSGEIKKSYDYGSFVSTKNDDHIEQICSEYPKRWHIEEFFENYQHLGWNYSRTFNLNIRYATLSMALIAQTVIHQILQKLHDSFSNLRAYNLSKQLFLGLDGDLRVKKDTIVVTYYNAPTNIGLIENYMNLPLKLERMGIDPRIPWLYNFKLDFSFK